MDEKLSIVPNFEEISEKQCQEWMASLGIEMTKVPKGTSKKPDYEIPSEGIGVEHTTFDYYKNAEPLRTLLASMADKFGTIQYVRLVGDSDGSEVSVERLSEKRWREDLAIVVIEYDISGIRKKNLAKLSEKIKQCRKYKKCLLIIDYRYFTFHSSALKAEWKNILGKHGKSYPSLIGVIIATRKDLDVELLSPPSLHFIQNPHASHSPPKELDRIRIMPGDRYGVKPLSIEVRARNKLTGEIDLSAILPILEDQVMILLGVRGPY